MSLTKINIDQLEASTACAIPWLAAKGHDLFQLLQLLPQDVLSLAAQMRK